MSYTIAVPYMDEVDLSAACPRMHDSLPAKSCVVAVDRLIKDRPVRRLLHVQ